ncbi:MAG: hypothetical protein GX483_05700 [Actinomycetaceae bacterium]|nr:hypothetical protein [Actinomycetaceae bacterium]
MAGGVHLIRKKVVALFAVFMLVAGVGVTVLPTSAQAAPPDPEPSLGGSWSCESSGECQYLDSSNNPYKSTWLLWNNKWYYFGFDGWMYRTVGEYTYANESLISGGYYRFDSSGAMVTGWVYTKYDDDGKYYWMYYGLDGRNVYDVASYIDGAWYVFDWRGFMVADATYETEDGKEYRLTASGKVYTGWYQDGADWYYYGSDGAMYKEQWLYSGGQWYYFDSAGKMCTDTGVESGGSYYRFTSSGAMLTGWYQGGSYWYYYGSDGAMYINKWLYYGGQWYAFWPDGTMRVDSCFYGFGKDYNVYCYGSSGAMATNGWFLELADDTWSYLSPSGVAYPGWQYIGGKWYYFGGPYCDMVTGIYKIRNVSYVFDSSGAWTGKSYGAGKAL